MNANGLCTIAAFAERWNMTGRFRVVKARRLLRRLEEKHEVELLIEGGGKGRGRRYLVNLPRLKEVMPVLFEGASPVEVQALKRDVDTLKVTGRRVRTQIIELKERIEALENKYLKQTAA